MLVVFNINHAGKLAGTVCDLDSSVATMLALRNIVKKVDGWSRLKNWLHPRYPKQNPYANPLKSKGNG